MCVFYSFIPRPLASFPGLWPHSQASGLIPRPLASFPGLWPHSQASGLIPRLQLIACTASNTHKARWGAEKKASVDDHYRYNACRYGYRLLIENSCADVLQPDITWMGGITEVCVRTVTVYSHFTTLQHLFCPR